MPYIWRSVVYFTTSYESNYIYSSIDQTNIYIYIYIFYILSIYTVQYTHEEKFTLRGTEDYKYSFLLL